MLTTWKKTYKVYSKKIKRYNKQSIIWQSTQLRNQKLIQLFRNDDETKTCNQKKWKNSKKLYLQLQSELDWKLNQHSYCQRKHLSLFFVCLFSFCFWRIKKLCKVAVTVQKEKEIKKGTKSSKSVRYRFSWGAAAVGVGVFLSPVTIFVRQPEGSERIQWLFWVWQL